MMKLTDQDFTDAVALFKETWETANYDGRSGSRTVLALGKVFERMGMIDSEVFLRVYGTSKVHAASQKSRSEPITRIDTNEVSDGGWECDGCKDVPYLHHVNEEFHIRNAYDDKIENSGEKMNPHEEEVTDFEGDVCPVCGTELYVSSLVGAPGYRCYNHHVFTQKNLEMRKANLEEKEPRHNALASTCVQRGSGIMVGQHCRTCEENAGDGSSDYAGRTCPTCVATLDEGVEPGTIFLQTGSGFHHYECTVREHTFDAETIDLIAATTTPAAEDENPRSEPMSQTDLQQLTKLFKRAWGEASRKNMPERTEFALTKVFERVGLIDRASLNIENMGGRKENLGGLVDVDDEEEDKHSAATLLLAKRVNHLLYYLDRNLPTENFENRVKRSLNDMGLLKGYLSGDFTPNSTTNSGEQVVPSSEVDDEWEDDLCLTKSGDKWECRAPYGHFGHHEWGYNDDALLFNNGWTSNHTLAVQMKFTREQALHYLRSNSKPIFENRGHEDSLRVENTERETEGKEDVAGDTGETADAQESRNVTLVVNALEKDPVRVGLAIKNAVRKYEQAQYPKKTPND